MSLPQADKDMEEILSSIRQIISEDVEENMKERAPGSDPVDVADAIPDNGHDVLELTQVLEDDETLVLKSEDVEMAQESVETVAAEPGSQDDIDALMAAMDTPTPVASVDDAVVETMVEPAVETVVEPATADALEAAMAQAFEGGAAFVAPARAQQPDVMPHLQEAATLISDATIAEASAALDGLQTLSSGVMPGMQGGATSLDMGQQSVESLVREMLRPMLKEWLDTNLPSLVKWLVAEQIEKVLQQRQIKS